MTLNRAAFVSALSSAAGLSASKFGLDAFANSPRHPGRRFSPVELRSDLEYLWQTLISVDPDPFRTSDAAFVKGLLRERSSSLTHRMTSAEFVMAVAPVFAALNDGHVHIGASMDSVPAMSFPLIPGLYGNKLIVEQGPPTLPLGSEILQVENAPASVIVEKVLEITGGQTFALRQTQATANMYFVLAMLLGASPEREYSFKALLPTGQPLAIKLKSRVSSSEHRHLLKPPNYTYRLYAENKIAVITYNRCEDAGRISKFLDATFLDVKRRSINALVVDMRQNLGGDSAVSDILLSRFAKRSFKQFGGTVIRSSGLIKRAYGHEQYVAEYGKQAWSAPDGQIIVTKSGDGDLVHPERLKPRFDGSVYMLIGPGTFSSGMSCASAAKHYGLATLVGEETGEPVNSTGEVFYVEAPISKTSGLFPTKVFLGPGPGTNRRGVIPDFPVLTSLKDIAAGYDPALAWVAKRVNEHKA